MRRLKGHGHASRGGRTWLLIVVVVIVILCVALYGACRLYGLK